MTVNVNKSPDINTWIDLVPSGNILKYLNLINLDSSSPCNLVLALKNTSLSALAIPENLVVTPSGETGSHTYNYRVTAANSNGETAPCSAVEISDGCAHSNLEAGVNTHAISWDSVSGATKYYVYCDIDGTMRIGKEITSGTSATNDGTWDLFPKWPWLNTEQIVTFFMYEALPANGIIQRYSEEEVPSGYKIVIALDNVMANFYARYLSI